VPRRLILLSAVALLAMSGQVLALEAATVFTEAAAATEGVLPASPPSMRVTDRSVDGPGHRGPLLDRLKTQRLRGHDLSDTAGDGGCGPQRRHQIPDAADHVVPAEGSDLR
jgi:hypothetical protein